MNILTRSGRGLVLCVLIAGLSVACRPVTSTEPPGIGINNGTTLTVALVVNGSVVGSISPGVQREIPASDLPALPWSVEARSPSGRVLVSMTVNAGDVSSTVGPNGESGSAGVGARVDLSCGRLDIWSGPPLLGPAPGSGQSGDCVP